MLCHTRESGLYPDDTGPQKGFRQNNGASDVHFSDCCSGEGGLEKRGGDVRRLLRE